MSHLANSEIETQARRIGISAESWQQVLNRDFQAVSEVVAFTAYARARVLGLLPDSKLGRDWADAHEMAGRLIDPRIAEIAGVSRSEVGSARQGTFRYIKPIVALYVAELADVLGIPFRQAVRKRQADRAGNLVDGIDVLPPIDKEQTGVWALETRGPVPAKKKSRPPIKQNPQKAAPQDPGSSLYRGALPAGYLYKYPTPKFPPILGSDPEANARLILKTFKDFRWIDMATEIGLQAMNEESTPEWKEQLHKAARIIFDKQDRPLRDVERVVVKLDSVAASTTTQDPVTAQDFACYLNRTANITRPKAERITSHLSNIGFPPDVLEIVSKYWDMIAQDPGQFRGTEGRAQAKYSPGFLV